MLAQLLGARVAPSQMGKRSYGKIKVSSSAVFGLFVRVVLVVVVLPSPDARFMSTAPTYAGARSHIGSVPGRAPRRAQGSPGVTRPLLRGVKPV